MVIKNDDNITNMAVLKLMHLLLYMWKLVSLTVYI